MSITYYILAAILFLLVVILSVPSEGAWLSGSTDYRLEKVSISLP
jgi:hypothetical protein